MQSALSYEKREKVEQIAKTLSLGATNLANKRAWRKSGVVKNVEWVTAGDPDVCGLCASLHGKVVGVNERFLKERDTLISKQGAEIIVTGNVEAPPLHPGCRCYCRPEEVSAE